MAQYAAMLSFRTDTPTLRHGDIAFLPEGDPVFAFSRTLDGQTLLCAFNLSGKPAKYALPADGGQITALPAPGASGVLDADQLTLPAYGYFFGTLGAICT